MIVSSHNFVDILLAFETAADDFMGCYIFTRRFIEINSRLFFKPLKQRENEKFIAGRETR